MRGNCNGVPDHDASSASTLAISAAAVATSIFLEYQPMRVLISVLFTAEAATLISTSPAFGTGTGRSWR